MTKSTTMGVRVSFETRRFLEEEVARMGFTSLTALHREIVEGYVASKQSGEGGASVPRTQEPPSKQCEVQSDSSPSFPSADGAKDPLDELLEDLFHDDRSAARAVLAPTTSPPNPGPELDFKPRVDRENDR